jgi:hypothetical protein
MTTRTASAGRRVDAIRRPTAVSATAVRAFLVGYGGTLVPLLAGLVALELGWTWLDGGTWPAAAAAVTGWSLAAAAWLHRRHWPSSTVGAVAGAPAPLLAGPIALGWVSPDGLVLWGPMTTLLAVACVMTMQPLALGPSASGPPNLQPSTCCWRRQDSAEAPAPSSEPVAILPVRGVR